jgi:hypothetical protein
MVFTLHLPRRLAHNEMNRAMTGYFSASGGAYHTHEKCPVGFAIPVELMRRGEVGDREMCHLCVRMHESDALALAVRQQQDSRHAPEGAAAAKIPEVMRFERRAPAGSRIWIKTVTAVLVSFVVFYAIPTLIEFRLARHVDPLITYSFFGDLLGCIGIAVFNWKFAVALYLGLAIVELLLARGGLIGLSTLPWLTDLVPAVIISLYAARKTADVAI